MNISHTLVARSSLSTMPTMTAKPIVLPAAKLVPGDYGEARRILSVALTEASNAYSRIQGTPTPNDYNLAHGNVSSALSALYDIRTVPAPGSVQRLVSYAIDSFQLAQTGLRRQNQFDAGVAIRNSQSTISEAQAIIHKANSPQPPA